MGAAGVGLVGAGIRVVGPIGAALVATFPSVCPPVVPSLSSLSGTSCVITIVFQPKLNEDIITELPALAQTGPFAIPLVCTTKKVAIEVHPSTRQLTFGQVHTCAGAWMGACRAPRVLSPNVQSGMQLCQ